MPNLVGIGNSQVPTNAMLGGLAYQDSIGEIDIDKIKAKVSDSAKAIFVYDTRKDSDGGAWRHRTQNLSWYNEGVNERRGARKEFPSVAVIVSEDTPDYKVTIYDGDDPNLSMWMQWIYVTNDPFLDYSDPGSHHLGNYAPLSLSAMNGIVCVGTLRSAGALSNLNAGLREFHFIKDECFATNNDKRVVFPTSIAHRNVVTTTYRQVYPNAQIVNSNVNDVAMTVLPNAPIDESTGLPIPTIAVATDGGVSVIKDDGSIFDTVATTSGYVASRKVEFSESGEYLYIIQDPSLIYSYKTSAFNIDRSSGTLAGYAALSFFSGYVSGSGPASDTKLARGNDITINIGHANTGLALLYPDYAYTSNGLDNASNKMICRVTKDFNTGWMHGNIKGAFLSDTDDTDVTGTELVTNGTFDSNVNNWVENTSTNTHSSGRMQITRSGGTGATAYQAFTTEVGKTYVATAEVNSSGSRGDLHVRDGTGWGGTGLLYVAGTASQTKILTGNFTATSTTSTIAFGVDNNNTSIFVDNVSVRIAEEDRSVNDNGLQVFGTVTKSPVAPGAELVAYSGFSASNYLQQPYNSDLDFGTGDLSIMFWFKLTSTGTPQCFIHRGDGGSGTWGSGNLIQIEMDTTHIEFQLAGSNFSPLKEAEVSVSHTPVGYWNHFVAVRRGGFMHVYANGVKYGNTDASTQDVSNTSAKLWVGQRPNSSRPLSNGSMALLRMSSTAPTDEQIKKMYDDEKCLFHENAKCTLHGTSDDVKAIAFDDTNGILHAGTSSGRSEFQGLNRINNTTTAVTTAISASNELVAEQ